MSDTDSTVSAIQAYCNATRNLREEVSNTLRELHEVKEQKQKMQDLLTVGRTKSENEYICTVDPVTKRQVVHKVSLCERKSIRNVNKQIIVDALRFASQSLREEKDTNVTNEKVVQQVACAIHTMRVLSKQVLNVTCLKGVKTDSPHPVTVLDVDDPIAIQLRAYVDTVHRQKYLNKHLVDMRKDHQNSVGLPSQTILAHMEKYHLKDQPIQLQDGNGQSAYYTLRRHTTNHPPTMNKTKVADIVNRVLTTNVDWVNQVVQGQSFDEIATAIIECIRRQPKRKKVTLKLHINKKPDRKSVV